jgi:hypothetical protein
LILECFGAIAGKTHARRAYGLAVTDFTAWPSNTWFRRSQPRNHFMSPPRQTGHARGLGQLFHFIGAKAGELPAFSNGSGSWDNFVQELVQFRRDPVLLSRVRTWNTDHFSTPISLVPKHMDTENRLPG